MVWHLGLCGKMEKKLSKFYNNKRVLITGHTGFKGAWLSSVLVELGAKVAGVALKAEVQSMYNEIKLDNNIKSYILDIRDFDSLMNVFIEFQPEIVFHLAAQPLVLASYENPRYTYDVNVMGTVNVLECVRLTKSVKSLVNVTTDKVYKNIEDANYFYNENDELNGRDPYSNSKSCSELVTSAYIKSFFENVSVSTCRAGNVIGGGDFSSNRIVPDCIRAFFGCTPLILRFPNSIRPYQFVLEPVIFYIILAMEQYYCVTFASSYNIGPASNDCITTLELVQLINNELNNKIEVLVSNNNHEYEANFLKLDSSKAARKFCWIPKLNINETVKLVISWYCSEDKILTTKNQIRYYLGKL